MSSVDTVQGTGQVADGHVTRHGLATRFNHWVIAVSVIGLIITSFLPILGIKFAWVTIHWITGLVFTASIIFHTVYAMLYQDWRSMWIKLSEFTDVITSMAGRLDMLKVSPGKYWLMQKVYHHVVTLFGVVVIITGILMMFKIDSPFWERDPYFLSSETWGIVYVLHGFASLCFVPMLMMHIYFAVRPEKLFYTRSMIKGWITKDEYLSHHDPEKWVVDQTKDRQG